MKFVILSLILIIFGGVVIANLEESIKKDRMIRESGGKTFSVDKDLQLIIDQANKRIIVNDGSNRLLAGKDAAGDIKIKLSKPTKDVLTASDVDLIWSSDFNLLKIVASGTATIPQAAAGYPGTTQTSVTVSFKGTGIEDPFAFMAFVEQGAGFDPLPLVADIGGDDLNIAYQVFARSFIEDSTPKIKFFLNNNDSAAVGPLKVKYYAFIETAKVD